MQPYCNYVSKNKWIKEKIKQKSKKDKKNKNIFAR